ncbi:MAG: hypothetical protein SP1CHLAM54_01630 [Chlamydiia bacterium]|nr:hypothetical protein [Chlamydiia bacterium]MCH9615081.1 hypothetical protein [Chlamydiia bacterium]MCH9628597.1 hypothetical protein [Chlamydiia bacterium]
MSADVSAAASNAFQSVGECLSNTASTLGDFLLEGWEVVSNFVQETVLPFFESMVDVVLDNQEISMAVVGGVAVGAALTYVVSRCFCQPAPPPVGG